MPGFQTVIRDKVLSAVLALNTAYAFPKHYAQRANRTVVYVVFGAGTSAGAFVVEEAYDDGAAEQWATIATLTWTANASRIFSANVQGPHNALRIRCSTAVVGGTADVYVNQVI